MKNCLKDGFNNNFMKKYYLSAFTLCFIFNVGNSQISDNISWSSISISKRFDQKNTLSITPTIRHNNNFQSYQNSSVDVHYAHTIDNNWGFGLITRTWFIPDGGNRQFVWFDFRYRNKVNFLKIFSGIRYHLALDINENDDPDFIRWKTKITFPTFGVFTPSIAIEPWLRLNGFEQYQRIRYEPRIDVQLQKKTKFSFTYRREETKNISPSRNFNMFVLTLGYSL